jgi:hypothetical protein
VCADARGMKKVRVRRRLIRDIASQHRGGDVASLNGLGFGLRCLSALLLIAHLCKDFHIREAS